MTKWSLLKETFRAFVTKAIFKGKSTDNLKKGVSKSIVHVIKHVNFQLYKARHDGVIWKKCTIHNKYINKKLRSGVEKKKLFCCN